MAYWLGGNPPTSVNSSSNSAIVAGNQVNLVPILLSGTTITTITTWNGDGTTYQSFFISPLLPAGTYVVGCDFYADQNGSNWAQQDYVGCRIVANSDTASTFIYPSNYVRPANNGVGATGLASAPIQGVVILRTDGYIYYQGVVYNVSGGNSHKVSMEQATYQRIA